METSHQEQSMNGGCPFHHHYKPDSTKSPSNKSTTNCGSHTLVASDQLILNSVPVISFLPDAVLIVVQDGRIIDCNSAASEMFGYEREELLNMSVHQLVPEKYRSYHPELTAEVFRSMKPRLMTQRRNVFGCSKSGRCFEVSVHLAPAFIRGTISSSELITDRSILLEQTTLTKIVTCVCRDMSLHNAMIRKRNEARQRIQSAESFLRLLNHEVRTGMHAIINSLETLKQEAFSLLLHQNDPVEACRKQLEEQHLIKPEQKELTHESSANPNYPRSPASSNPLSNSEPDANNPEDNRSANSPLLYLKAQQRSIGNNNDTSIAHLLSPRNFKDDSELLKALQLVRSLLTLEGGVAAMDVLFRNLLDLRSLSANTFVRIPAAVDLNNFFDTLRFNHRARWMIKRQRISIQVPDSLPLIVCDLMLLTRLVESLLDNCIKHSGTNSDILLHVIDLDQPNINHSSNGGQHDKKHMINSVIRHLSTSTPEDIIKKYQILQIEQLLDMESEIVKSDYSCIVDSEESKNVMTQTPKTTISPLKSSTLDPLPVNHVILNRISAKWQPLSLHSVMLDKDRSSEPSEMRIPSITNETKSVHDESESGRGISTPLTESTEPSSYISFLLDKRVGRASKGRSSAPKRLLFIICDNGRGLRLSVMNNLEEQLLHNDSSTTRITTGGVGLGLQVAKECAVRLNTTFIVSSNTKRARLTPNVSESTSPVARPTEPPQLQNVFSSPHNHWTTAFSFAGHFETASSTKTNENDEDLDSKLRCALLTPGSSIDISTFRSLSNPRKQRSIVQRLLSKELELQRKQFRILIVEDNAINIKVVKRICVKNGFTSIAIARNGLEALKIVQQRQATPPTATSQLNLSNNNNKPGQQHFDRVSLNDENRSNSALHRFDLILMDCEMPIMDGYTCATRLRELGYLFPIFALTADASEKSQQKCLNAGMDLFVNKPLPASSLLFAIASLPPFQLYPLECCPHVLIPTSYALPPSSESTSSEEFA